MIGIYFSGTGNSRYAAEMFRIINVPCVTDALIIVRNKP